MRFVIEAGDGEEGSPLLTRFRELAYHGLRASNSLWMARILEEMRRNIVGEGVDVKLIFEFGLGTLDAGTISKMRADGCEDLLMEMHDILGAEVWVDDAMCYKDGKVVQKIFGDRESAADGCNCPPSCSHGCSHGPETLPGNNDE